VADRLRDLIDLVLSTLDDPGADGRALATRASFSRDHLDRLLAASTGESPVGLRRRLLLERAAWQLRSERASPTEATTAAGYGSLAAFSRAFARAYGIPPSGFADSGRPVELPAPNGIHFHPPAGLLVPAAHERERDTRPRVRPATARDLTDRLVSHHLDRTRELLVAAAGVAPDALAQPRRPGLVIVWFEGEEASAGLMARRLVWTLELWMASVVGEHAPDPPDAEEDLVARLDRVAPRFARFARRVRDDEAWDDAFVDAICEPPQAFTYGGVLAHVVTYGAVRREALAGVLAELGVEVSCADPISWEQRTPRRSVPAGTPPAARTSRASPPSPPRGTPHDRSSR
jgi:AraC family transcriptional regulator